MPKLIEQKVHIGQDAYGRRIIASRTHSYDGKSIWSIVSEPASQRDEGERMSGLTDQNIRDLIQALDCIRS